MRRIYFLFLIVILFFSCDDGSFQVDNFDFSTGTTQSCNQETNNFFIYRLSSNEVLIVRVPQSTFTYDVTPLLSPNTLDPILINNNAIQVVYRLYNGAVTNNTLCSLLPPIAPTVVDEWIATSGTINVVTNVTKVDNTGISSDNATRINGYNHEIEFRNINFFKGNGTEQFYDVLVFGSFQNQSTNSLSNFTGAPLLCADDTQKVLYKTTNNQLIALNLPNALFINETTPDNQPRVAYFDANHTVKYLILNAPLATTNSFCIDNFTALETWEAQEGDQNLQTGAVEVTTIQSSEGFEHTIVLKKAVMVRGEVNFTFGDSYTFGTIVVAP